MAVGDKTDFLSSKHDIHDLENISAPSTDGTYFLKLTKSGSSLTYEYIDSTAVGSGPTVVTAAVSPQNAPDTIGDIYVDTVTGDIYIAKGTSGYADWILVS